MNSSAFSVSLSQLDSATLTARIASLAERERESLVEFLLHLAEFDARELYLAAGYPSLHAYCNEHLKLSNGCAFRRYTGARLLRRFPVIAEFLRDGRLNLTRLVALKDVLTDENHLDLFGRAMRVKERDLPNLVAALQPQPDVEDSIRKAPVRTTTASSVSAPRTSAAEVNSGTAPPTVTATRTSAAEVNSGTVNTPASERVPAASGPTLFESPGLAPSPKSKLELIPTSATRMLVKMSVPLEFVEEFEAVKAALSHKIPDGDFEEVFRECFRITLEHCNRRRLGSLKKVESSVKASAAAATQEAAGGSTTTEATQDSGGANSETRYIPVHVRRAVWKRDEGRCAFVSAQGRRCGSTHQVQFHHLVPYALGGTATEENLSLRCRRHNHHEAVVAFGAEFMAARVPSGCRVTSAAEVNVRPDTAALNPLGDPPQPRSLPPRK